MQYFLVVIAFGIGLFVIIKKLFTSRFYAYALTISSAITLFLMIVTIGEWHKPLMQAGDGFVVLLFAYGIAAPVCVGGLITLAIPVTSTLVRSDPPSGETERE